MKPDELYMLMLENKIPKQQLADELDMDIKEIDNILVGDEVPSEVAFYIRTLTGF